ncbi:hypothetical protein L3X38_004614 [Prunus dulcis]|uniref:CCHC-type domain-containing protein n=1 Tax=Prunus dulcis TaxID=3755 RepID=A0AAD5F3F7_PRUDU|nr:hypothetical protein L3X38_004614 [Prunus dulcis]
MQIATKLKTADPGLLIKRSTMSRLASDVVDDALMSEEGCELLSETLKSLQEKAMKRGIRHCRECGHIGHDRRQCPRNFNTP